MGTATGAVQAHMYCPGLMSAPVEVPFLLATAYDPFPGGFVSLGRRLRPVIFRGMRKAWCNMFNS